MTSSALSAFCRPIAPEGAFCKPEEDPFLLLESNLRCIERILQFTEGRPLHRTWIEHPYGEEEITLLEEEVLPALQHCLQRVNEIDAALQEEQDARIAIAQLQEIQEAERLLAQAEADQPPWGAEPLRRRGLCAPGWPGARSRLFSRPMAGASWRGKRLGGTLLWSRTGQAVPPSRADGDKGEPSDAGL